MGRPTSSPPAGPDVAAGTAAAPASATAADPTGEVGQLDAARTICLRLLTAAPRTRAQLAAALARRGVAAAAAEAALDRLTEVGLVDDAGFAAAWVDSRHAGRALGRRALAAELRDRGVAGPVAAAALDRLDRDAELAAARALVDRRLAGMAGLDRPTRYRRLIGLLARRGYGSELAATVVGEALARGAAGTGVPLDPEDPPT